ncbi:SURF1 family protein [Candidatus Pelagibacter sp.]|nr:SURF1 family protein [Candidatus Pelagibacter sp.]
MKNKLAFSLFVYFFILVFLSLGVWQMIRLDWKLTLIKQINQSLDSEPSEFNGTDLKNFRSIKFVGKIDYNNQIYLYSLNEKGAPGFDLINPIIINNKLFLVNRGWIPRNQKGKKFQLNNKNFTAILKEKSKFNYFKPENDLENNYWFTLNDEDLNKFTGKIFPNYIIYLNNRVNDKNYPLQKNITANISNNHLKYALTWFSLAISIFLIYLYFRKKNY